MTGSLFLFRGQMIGKLVRNDSTLVNLSRGALSSNENKQKMISTHG